MALAIENKNRKHDDIRSEYKKLKNTKDKNGKRLYTTEKIIGDLAIKYYLSEKTIEGIVWSN